ncbi:MAG TPA: hypothetical protein VF378_10535, partial [Geothrix sp.]
AEVNLFGAPTFEACAMRGEGVRETLTGVAKLVLKSLAERYGGGVVEEPAALMGGPFMPPPQPIGESTKPLEVQEISAGELLEEDGEAPEEASSATHGPASEHLPLRSVVEVPVVLDRSLFSGDSPIEIRLKLYIK